MINHGSPKNLKRWTEKGKEFIERKEDHKSGQN